MEILSSETRALVALHLVPGIGPRLTAALLERFGSAQQVLKATTEELQNIPHIAGNLASRIRQAMVAGDVDVEIAAMREHGVRVAVKGEPGYPTSLALVDGAPPLLYIAGDLLPADARAIAVVGSRHCTSYGKRVAERLGNDLARAGFTVVSGLARGIDGAAHEGALKAGGRTLAVLAGGLGKIYPPEHAELAGRVKAQGALISESGMRMEPMAGMFPARNRIISGLSRAVIVVEAAEKSGALITAEHAANQGREVFAIPGQVDSHASGGTLKLLRHGARLARHAGDVLADLEELSSPTEEIPLLRIPPNLADVEKAIWDFLTEPRYIDDLARRTGKPITELSGILMALELKRVIRRLPGNMYERM